MPFISLLIYYFLSKKLNLNGIVFSLTYFFLKKKESNKQTFACNLSIINTNQIRTTIFTLGNFQLFFFFQNKSILKSLSKKNNIKKLEKSYNTTLSQNFNCCTIATFWYSWSWNRFENKFETKQLYIGCF